MASLHAPSNRIASDFMFFNDEKECKILMDNTINSVAASHRIMYIKHLLTDTHKLGYKGNFFKTGDGSLNILKDISCYPMKLINRYVLHENVLILITFY